MTQKLLQSGLFGLAYVVMGIGLGALGPTLEPLAQMLDVSVGTMGWLFFARGIGALVGALGLGKLYDLFDARIVFATGVLLLGIAMGLIALTPPFPLLVVAHWVLGLSVGYIDTGANALIVIVWKGDPRLTGALQALHFTFGVGSILIGVLAAAVSVRTAYALSAIGTFLVAMLQVTALAMPPIPTSDTPAAVELEMRSTGAADEEDVGVDSDKEDSAAAGEPPAAVGPRWLRPEVEIVALLALFLTTYVGVEVAYGGLIGAFGIHMLGMDEATAALLTSAYWLFFTIGRLVAIPVSQVVSETRMMFVNMVGCFLAMVLLALLPDTAWAVWVASVSFGFAMAPIFPNAIAMPPYFGLILSVSSTRFLVFGASLGEMTVPWIGATCFDFFGPRSLPYVMFGTLIVAVGIYGTLLVRFRHRRT